MDVTVDGVSALRPVSIHRTSATQNLAQLTNPPVSGSTVSLRLPARPSSMPCSPRAPR